MRACRLTARPAAHFQTGIAVVSVAVVDTITIAALPDRLPTTLADIMVVAARSPPGYPAVRHIELW
jgi:hypothetical protein